MGITLKFEGWQSQRRCRRFRSSSPKEDSTVSLESRVQRCLEKCHEKAVEIGNDGCCQYIGESDKMNPKDGTPDTCWLIAGQGGSMVGPTNNRYSYASAV